MAEITKDTIIGDLLDAVPSMESVFLAHGMHCHACSSARGETIEQACLLHDIDADALVSTLRAYKSE